MIIYEKRSLPLHTSGITSKPMSSFDVDKDKYRFNTNNDNMEENKEPMKRKKRSINEKERKHIKRISSLKQYRCNQVNLFNVN